MTLADDAMVFIIQVLSWIYTILAFIVKLILSCIEPILELICEMLDWS